MADEPQTEANPATEYQPPASVITVYDVEGREHFAAPTSKFVADGLADGTLTEQPPAKTEEVADGTETGSTGDDPKPGNADGGDGSGDGAPGSGGSGRRRRAGQA
jgi:hypothetical protein